MAKLKFIAAILAVSVASVAAYGDDDHGLTAPELNKPAPGQLLNRTF